MLASLLIIGFSLALLVYWFRYSCILLLRNYQQPLEPSRSLVDSRFRVSEVQQRLQTAEPLDPLHTFLQRDYQVLTYLLEHAAGLELEAFEDRLLVIDFKVMRWWYCLTRTAAPVQARQALKEMAEVLGILVGKIDRRAGLHTEI
jgi:hypothetical protein